LPSCSLLETAAAGRDKGAADAAREVAQAMVAATEDADRETVEARGTNEAKATDGVTDPADEAMGWDKVDLPECPGAEGPSAQEIQVNKMSSLGPPPSSTA
jgi:hypothetical protein